MTDSLVDDESLAKIGTVVAVATGEVYRRDWQRWAAAVGDHNPLWFDPDYARAHGYRDITCPPLYLQYAVLGAAALGDLRPDGSSGAVTGSLAFPKAPRRMAGGETTIFHRPAYHRVPCVVCGKGVSQLTTSFDVHGAVLAGARQVRHLMTIAWRASSEEPDQHPHRRRPSRDHRRPRQGLAEPDAPLDLDDPLFCMSKPGQVVHVCRDAHGQPAENQQ